MDWRVVAGGRGSVRKFLLIWGNNDECMNETLTLGMERCDDSELYVKEMETLRNLY